jgi:hypothetical protein
MYINFHPQDSSTSTFTVKAHSHPNDGIWYYLSCLETKIQVILINLSKLNIQCKFGQLLLHKWAILSDILSRYYPHSFCTPSFFTLPKQLIFEIYTVGMLFAFCEFWFNVKFNPKFVKCFEMFIQVNWFCPWTNVV